MFHYSTKHNAYLGENQNGVTRHPVYREYLQDFENSDTIMKNGFLLGAHHGMDIEDVDYVCSKVKEFFNA